MKYLTDGQSVGKIVSYGQQLQGTNRERNPEDMTADTTEQTTPTKPTKQPKKCQCLYGWQGEGSGSALDSTDRYACERTTNKTFAQGHDARMSARLASEVANELTDLQTAVELIQNAGGSPTLVAKTVASAKRRLEDRRKKAEKEAAKAEAKAAKASAGTTPDEPTEDA